MNDYFIYYTESNVICLIIFGILLLHDYLNVDRQEKQIKYDHALICFMLYFVADTVWAAVIAGVLPASRPVVVLVNLADQLLMAAITYAWLLYFMAAVQIPGRDSRRIRFLNILPFLLSTVVLGVTYFLAPHLLLNEELELQPMFNVFLIAIPCVYIIAMIVCSVRAARRTVDPLEKQRYLYIGFFPLTVVGGGLLQILVLKETPIFCFSCAIMMLVFYIRAMETRISMDPLTKLNNRGQLMRYGAQPSSLRRDGRLTFVVMIDVNSFKRVNDTFGHAEGDRALVIIADSLRTVARAQSMPVFLCRYGGDEFILIAHPVGREEIGPLIGEVRAQIESRCRRHATPYLLSVSVGCDELLPGEDTLQRCMQRADKKLYQDKERSGR